MPGSERVLSTRALASLRHPWLAFAVPLVVFSSALRGRIVMAPGDGYGQYIPWYTLAAEAWRRLSLPSWNPYPFAGAPLLAAGQPAVFYPPNLLFAFIPIVIANNLTIVISFFVAGTGAYFLARHLTRDPVAATVGGLAFGLCGFMFAHIGHQSMIATTAWLPWVLFGYEKARERTTPLRVLLGALPLTLCVFAGHVQLFTFVCAVLAAYVTFFTLLDLKQSRGRPALAGAAVIVVALALAAVQLVPTAAYVGDTQRSHIPYEQAITYALPKSHLPLVVFPYLFGASMPDTRIGPTYTGQWNLTELTWYPGILALVLAAVGLSAVRRDRRLMALTIVAAGLFVVAMGPATPVSRLLYRVPIYGQYRAWARYLVGWDLVVAMLAAAGVVVLRTATGRARLLALVRGGAVVAAVALAAVVVPRLPRVRHFMPDGIATWFVLWMPVVAAFVALGAIVLVVRRPRAGLVALVVLAAAEPVALFGYDYQWRGSGPTPEQLRRDRNSRDTFWGGVTDRPGGLDRFMFVGTDIQPVVADAPAITDFKDVRSANGNDPLTPRAYAEAAGRMTAYGGTLDPGALWAPASRVFDLLRVTTVILHPDSAAGGPPPGALLAGGTELEGNNDSRLLRFEHDPLVGDAFLVGAAETRSRAAVLRAVTGQEPFDPAAVALLDEPCDECPTGPPGPAGRVLRTSFGQNTVTVDYVADRPAVLVVSQAHIAGWTATVDGRDVPVHRVDGLVKGAPVPAGSHTVTFHYVPPGLRAGGAITGLTLVGLLGWTALDRRRRRAPDTAEHPQQEYA